MSYDFSLNKKKIGLLLTGFTVLTILVFIAGWLLGLMMNLQREAPPLTEYGAAGKNISLPAPPPAAITKSASMPEKKADQKALTAAVETPAAPETDPVQEKAPALKTDEPVSKDKSSPSTAPAPAPEAPEKKKNEKMCYSIQAGAFLFKDNAEKRLSELKGKGYNAYIFETTDHLNRKWHAVKTADFTTLQKASSALAQFTRKENMPAVITCFKSLTAVDPEKDMRLTR